MKKLQLRQELKEKLSHIEKPFYEDKSVKIARKLYSQPEWVSSKTIGLTVSNPPEVDTYQIIRKAWEQGKRVVVPKCNKKTKEMTFRELTAFSELEKVYFNLYEPIEQLTRKVLAEEIDLLIVPGLAFTREGYRLGFGGGYYDRYLVNYTGANLSLAFSEQMVGELPIDSYDLPVKKIISDSEVIQIDD